MATTEERLAALETKLAALTATTPTEYYTHQYSGEEIDAAVGRAVSGGALDTSVTNVSNQLGTFVRPNLLDNWYFGNPVNQRGQTEYTGNGYTVDRWKLDIDIGTVTVESDGIVLDGGSTGCTLYELQEPALLSMLEGQILTFSAMYTILSQMESPGCFGTTIPGSYVARCIFGGSVGVKNVASGSAVMPTNLQSVSWFYIPAGCKIKIHAVKVELGSTQTLAHREGDKWILNEVPDNGEQLRRCQRYFVRMKLWAGQAIGESSTIARGVLNVPVPMRTSPAISISNMVILGNFGYRTITSINTASFCNNLIGFRASVSDGLSVDTPYLITNDGDGYIDISADL